MQILSEYNTFIATQAIIRMPITTKDTKYLSHYYDIAIMTLLSLDFLFVNRTTE